MRIMLLCEIGHILKGDWLMTDEFFGTLYISDEHMDAVDRVYGDSWFSIPEGTIEELSELIMGLYPSGKGTMGWTNMVLTSIMLLRKSLMS